MKDFLETATYALVTGLILIAVYVLYQRLLKAVGKGKYENFYMELENHRIDWDNKELIMNLLFKRREQVKIQVLDKNKQVVIPIIDEEVKAGDFDLSVSIATLPVGQYKTVITTPTQVVSRYFKVKELPKT